MYTMPKVWKFAVLAILLCAIPYLSLSQSTYGTLTGTVNDSSGAVIVGATVVITNQATMVSRTVITGADGTFLGLNLDAGQYRVSAEMQGFNPRATDGSGPVGQTDRPRQHPA